MWSCLLIFVALCPLRTDAEGSATIFPSSGVCDSIFLGGSCRANIEWRSDSYGPVSTSVQRRTLFYVFANAGETLFLGSTARNAPGTEVDRSDILVYRPGRISGRKGSEVIPALAAGDLSCRTSQPAVGRIASRAEELAGPQVSGGPPGGYVPCTYVAASTGIYNVIMYGPAGDGNQTNGYVTGDLGLSSGMDQSQGSSIAGWDITVRNSLTSTVNLPGRVFTYAIAAFTGANDRPVYMTYYVVLPDGYRYQVQTHGMDPNGWVMYGNQLGFLDPDGVSPLYHDVRGNNGDLNILQGGAKFAEPQYPLFLSPADNATLVALNVPVVPTIPVISGLTFTGTAALNTALYGSGGTFSFTSNVQAVYEIILSSTLNFDPTLPTNRVLRGATPLGSHSVTWNGRDNAGSLFSVGSYQVKATIHGGEYHFPFIDVENNVLGGPFLSLTNGVCPSWNGGCNGAFYDDRGYRTSSGGVVGVVNGALCPSQGSGGSASDAMLGFDTTSGERGFGDRAGNANVDCLGAFGDAKGLDLWTYIPSAPMQTPVWVVDHGVIGHVYQDLDDSGAQDFGEPDLAGYTVEITNGVESGMGITDARGNYAIHLPIATDYEVTVRDPLNGYVSTYNNPQSPFDVAAQLVLVADPVGFFYPGTPSPTAGVVPLIGGSPPSTAVVGQSYSYQFFATAGAPAPQFSFTGLAAWMNVNTATGEVSGMPNAVGTYTVGVTAFNAHGSSSLSYTLVVSGYAPQIIGTPNLTTTYGTPYSESFAIDGFPFPDLEVFGPSWMSISSTGLVSGTPNASSSSLVEVRASNVYGNASLFYTLSIVASSPGVSGTPPPAVINTPYSYQYVVSGFPAPVLTLVGPAWLSISPSGVLSGTPPSIGTFSVQITSSNSAGSNVQPYSFVVNGIPPSITSSAPPSGALGGAYNHSVTATGTPPPTFTLSGPPGLFINPTSGVISGTPTEMGIFTLTVTASNGYGSDSVQTSTITIGALPPTTGAPSPAVLAAPHITSNPSLTALIGSLYSYSLTATGNPVPTFSIVSGPTWLSLNGTMIQGIPQPSDDGSIVMIVRADNGISPNDVQTFRLTVSMPSPTPVQSPVITSSPPTQAYIGVPFSYELTYIGAAPVFILAGSLPDWLDLQGCCTLVGTPTQLGLTAPIVLTASNGFQPNDLQTFQLNVVPAITNAPTGKPTQPPSTQPTSITPPIFTSAPETSATIGAPYVYYITTFGFPTPTITTRLIDLPSWLHFNGNTLSGTPIAGTAGSVAISLTASNGINPNATQVFTLTVSNIPSAAAILSNAPLTAAVGALYVYPILTSGSPTPNISLTAGPSFLSLAMNGGILSLIGSPNSTGTFSVTVTAFNGVGGPAVQTYTLTVSALSAAPTAAPTAPLVPPSFTSLPGNLATSGSPFSYILTATGSPAPQFTLYGAPSWLTLTNGTLSGTPPSSLTGTLTFRIVADNGVSPVASQLVTIQVNPKTYTSPVITSNATTTIGSGLLYTYVASATGFPAPVFLWSLPDWLTVSSSNFITGRPPRAGTYSVSLRASNGMAPADVQTFVINVYQSTFSPTPVGTVSGGNGQFSPLITSTPPATALTGMTYTYVVTMTGTPVPNLIHSPLPSWLSLTGCCTLSGVVPGVITGSTSFGLTAINGVYPPATQTVQVNFADPAVLRITSIPILSAQSTKLYNYVITTTGSPAPIIISDPLPSWLSLVNGVLSGTPPAGTTGTSVISITASNGVGANVQQNFSLSVVNPTYPPTITSQAPATAVAGQTYSYTIVTTGNPAPTLSVTGNPPWLTLSGNVLSGVATGSGTLPPITIAANNTVLPTFTQRFTLDVISLPTISSPSQPESVPYGTIYNVAYTMSGNPKPTLSISDNPAWISLTGRVVTGTPPLSMLGSVACYTLTATNSAGSNRKAICFDVILPSQESCQDGLQRIKGELDYHSRVDATTCPNALSSDSVSVCHSQCNNPVAYVNTLVLANGFLGRRLLTSPFNSSDEVAIASSAATVWGLPSNNVYTLSSDTINVSHTAVKLLAVAPEGFAFAPLQTAAGRSVAETTKSAASQSDMLDLLALLLRPKATSQGASTQQAVIIDDSTPWWVYFLLVVLIISFLCWALFCFKFLRGKDRARPLKRVDENDSVRRGEELDGKHDDNNDRALERQRLQQQLKDLLALKRRTLADITELQAEIQREQENRLADGDQFEQEREVSRLLKQMVELEATQQKQHAAQIAALNTEILGLRRAGGDRSAYDPDSGAVQEQIRELGSAYQELKREQELQKQMQIKEQKKLLDTVENLSRALEKSRGEGDGLRERLEREHRDREAAEQVAAADRVRLERERAERERARDRQVAERSDKDRLERDRLEEENVRLQNERDRTERRAIEAEQLRDREAMARQQRERAKSSSSQQDSNFHFSDDSGLDDESGGSGDEGMRFPKGPGMNEDDGDMAKFSTLSHADKGVFEQWKAREAHAKAQKAKEKRKAARQLARRQARHLARREAKAAARATAGLPQ